MLLLYYSKTFVGEWLGLIFATRFKNRMGEIFEIIIAC